MSDRDDKVRPSVKGDSELSKRLDNLDRQLGDRRLEEERETQRLNRPAPQGTAMALRLASDFVAGVVLGVALGWGFDRLFGTSPWGLVVFLLLGFAAGLLAVVRSAGLVKPGPTGSDKFGDGI
jgi:ATP synthase protein I